VNAALTTIARKTNGAFRTTALGDLTVDTNVRKIIFHLKKLKKTFFRHRLI